MTVWSGNTRVRIIAESIAAVTKGPVARGSLWSIGFRIGTPVLGFLQAVLTARLLGPEGYGIVAVALSVALIAATIAMLGFGQLAVREVARLSATGNSAAVRGFVRFAGSSVFVASLIVAGGLATVALGTSLVATVYRPAIGLAAIFVPPLALIVYFRGVCLGFGLIVIAQFSSDVLRHALFVILLAFLFFSGVRLQPLSYLAISLLVLTFVACVVALIARSILVARIPSATAEFHSRDWWVSARSFLALSMLSILAIEATTLLLGWLANPVEVGLFQPIARVTPFMLLGMQAVAIPYSPRVAELWESRKTDQLKDITSKATLAATCSVFITCVAIIMLSTVILSSFGCEFLSIAPALWWVASAQVFGAACGPVTELLTMTRHEWLATKAQAAAIAVAALVALVAIPEHGAFGAAISLAAGIVACNILMLVSVRRNLGFDPSLLRYVGGP